jgi:hypothetical protein
LKLTIAFDIGGVEVVGSQQRELARVVVGHFGEQDSVYEQQEVVVRSAALRWKTASRGRF